MRSLNKKANENKNIHIKNKPRKGKYKQVHGFAIHWLPAFFVSGGVLFRYNYKDMSGWIKLHRKITCHWIFQKPEYLHAWITILLKVNHSDKKVLIQGELIECGRGQSLNSLATWTGLFGRGWTIQKTRTFFKLLKNDNMINIEGLRKTTRLTVCNYDSYQDEQHTNNTQTTRKQHTDNTQITTNKNDKNDKNDKNNKYNDYISTINNVLNTKFRVTDKMKPKIAKILKEFTIEEIETAVKNAKKDSFHAEHDFKYLTSEFFTRSDKVEAWLNSKGATQGNNQTLSGSILKNEK